MPTPRKPTALKLLDGNPGKQKLPQNEPKPRPITPDPPEFLSETARKRWNELLPELEYMGTLTLADADIFAGYCMAYATVVELTADIEAFGRTYCVGSNGALASRPEVAALNRAWDDIRRFGAELGIGAASRTKIEVKKQEHAKDPLAEIMEANSRGRTAR